MLCCRRVYSGRIGAQLRVMARSSSTTQFRALPQGKIDHSKRNAHSLGTLGVQPAREQSLADRIIMNTMSKVQALIIRETETAWRPETPSTQKWLSSEDLCLITDESAVSDLLLQPLEVQPHVLRSISKTHDSHQKLDELLAQPLSPQIPAEAYLQMYLRVRFNVNHEQLQKLLEALVYHRWYRNASLLLIESCKSLDEIMDKFLIITQAIAKFGDSKIGIDEVFMSFPNAALLPQIIKNFVNASISNDRFSYTRSFKRIIQMGKAMEEQARYADQFGSLDNLAEHLDQFTTDAPISVRLLALNVKIQHIKSMSLADESERVSLLKDTIESEFEQEPELTQSHGVVSRLMAMVSPKDPASFEMLSDLSSKLTMGACDYETFISHRVPFPVVKQLYSQYSRSGLRSPGFVTAVVDRLTTRNNDNTDSLLLEILQAHRDQIPLYQLGKVLVFYRRDAERFKEVMSLIDSASYGYVLGALGRQLVYEYQRCQSVNKMITFDEIFALVDVLKSFKADQFSFLKHVFHEILMDGEFMSHNRAEFKEKFRRFVKESRVKPEIIGEWNFTLFSKFNETQDDFLVDEDFQRKFVIRVMRLQTGDRRNALLEQYGRYLTVLPHETAASLINGIVNGIDREIGRNVISVQVATTIFRVVLEKYVEDSFFQVGALESQYHSVLKVLSSIRFVKHPEQNKILLSNPKHLLMETVVGYDPKLGSKLIKSETDYSLLKGYLLGVISTERLESSQKIRIIHDTIQKRFQSQGHQFMGQKIMIKLCNLIIQKLNENEMSRLTSVHRFLWVLKHCQLNRVHKSHYFEWYSAIRDMKEHKRGYWTQSGTFRGV